MKYRLYKDKNDFSNIMETFLNNRDIKHCQDYLSLDDNKNIDYKKLNNIKIAVESFMFHFNNKNKIGILVDEDVDGYCSAAMMYLAIKEMDKEYPVEYILHEKTKVHGLNNVLIDKDIKLLIIPDASTNDAKECRALSEYGMDIIILDHHEKEVNNPYAIIVNNQMSDEYDNKDFCGAGIVYKFLQALDDTNWTEIADNYLDLCALANISDVMDMRSFETKYLTELGIKQMKQDGGNKFINALIESQSFSLNGKINIHNVQWVLTPKINALIRIGSLEEKELLFRAFIEQDEYFEYKKRATKDKPAEIIQESVYERAARFCVNTKGRQDKLKEKSIIAISETLNKTNLENEKCIVFDVTDILDSGLTGVVAIKISEMFQRPCLLLNKRLINKNISDMKYNADNQTIISEKTGEPEITYGGSARNWDESPIEDFKQVINSTGLIKGAGHANAFGCFDLKIDDLDNIKNKLNDILSDIEYEDTYKVDYILDINDLNIGLIREFSYLEDMVAQGLPDPLLAVENITLNKDNIEIIGKKEDTIKFNIDGIEFVQFKCSSGNELYDWINDIWSEDSVVTFNIVGAPCMHEYDGRIIPQINIKDLEVINSFSCSNEEDDFDLEDW